MIIYLIKLLRYYLEHFLILLLENTMGCCGSCGGEGHDEKKEQEQAVEQSTEKKTEEKEA